MVTDQHAAQVVINGLNSTLSYCKVDSDQDYYVVLATTMQTAADMLEHRVGLDKAMQALASILGEMAQRSPEFKARIAEFEARQRGRSYEFKA